MSTSLTDRELAVLEFARGRWKHEGARDSAIRDYFGMTPPRYSQVLVSVLRKPAAVAYDAVLVRHLRDRLDARALPARRHGFQI